MVDRFLSEFNDYICRDVHMWHNRDSLISIPSSPTVRILSGIDRFLPEFNDFSVVTFTCNIIAIYWYPSLHHQQSGFHPESTDSCQSLMISSAVTFTSIPSSPTVRILSGIDRFLSEFNDFLCRDVHIYPFITNSPDSIRNRQIPLGVLWFPLPWRSHSRDT